METFLLLGFRNGEEGGKENSAVTCLMQPEHGLAPGPFLEPKAGPLLQ